MNIKSILLFSIISLLSPWAIAGTGHDHDAIQPTSLLNSE